MEEEVSWRHWSRNSEWMRNMDPHGGSRSLQLVRKRLESIPASRTNWLVNPYADGDVFFGKSHAKPFRNPSLTMLFLTTFCSTFSILLILLLVIFQSPNRNMFVRYVAKRWTSRIVTFSRVNVATKFVCGAGTGSRNRNRDCVLRVVRPMETIRTNSVPWM